MNDRVIPMFAEHDIDILRVLTDRGTEYCGKLEDHAYQLYLSVEGIEHTRAKACSLQTTGIVERFHKTIKHEFYDVIFKQKIIESIEELQFEVDNWLKYYNKEQTHSVKYSKNTNANILGFKTYST